MQETVDVILKAAVEEAAWEDAVDRVCFEIGAPASALFMSEDLGMRSKTTIFSDFWMQPERWELRQMFKRDLDVSADGPAYSIFKHMQSQTLTRETDIFGRVSSSGLPRSAVRDLTFSYGFNDRVVSILNNRGPWIDVLTFQVKDQTLDTKKFSRLSSTLSSAMRMRHMLRDARKQAILATEALDRLPIGVFALTSDGWLIFANAEAQRQSSELEQISLKHDRLFVSGVSERYGTDATDFSSIPLNRKLIHQLEPRAFLLKNLAQKAPVLAQIEPSSGLYGDATFLVFTFNLERVQKSDASLLSRLAGLTNAEADVLKLLAQGKSSPEIAEVRGTSRITTRNQLQSIMEKLRCSSQRDLVALNAATALAQIK